MAVTINGSTGVQLDDNDKQEFGTGDDLKIYHDGTHSYITNTGASGGIKLQHTGNNRVLKLDHTDGDHCYITFMDDDTSDDGQVRVGALNNDLLFLAGGTEKARINSSGHFLPGAADSYDLGANTTPWRNIWMENDLYIEDNGKAVFGTGEDFKIYHDGSNSFITNDTGVISSWSADNHEFKSGNGNTRARFKNGGSCELYYNNSKKGYTTDDGWRVEGDCYPTSNGTGMNLGQSSERWDTVYASTGTINTSDKNEKNTIVETDLGLSFVNKLKPVSYKFNGKTRTHYGLIAQDVETTLSDISKPTTGFAGFIKEDIPDKLYVEQDEIPEGKKVGDLKTAAYTTYGLRYNEFISPLIKAVQELSAEVNTLKTKVAALEAHTHE